MWMEKMRKTFVGWPLVFKNSHLYWDHNGDQQKMEFKRRTQTQAAGGIPTNINIGTEEDAAGGVGGGKAVQDKQSDPQNQSCYREK